jgi:hypothetical protein
MVQSRKARPLLPGLVTLLHDEDAWCSPRTRYAVRISCRVLSLGSATLGIEIGIGIWVQRDIGIAGWAAWAGQDDIRQQHSAKLWPAGQQRPEPRPVPDIPPLHDHRVLWHAPHCQARGRQREQVPLLPAGAGTTLLTVSMVPSRLVGPTENHYGKILLGSMCWLETYANWTVCRSLSSVSC